jgi:hypothetical protein
MTFDPGRTLEPMKLKELLWPHVRFYKEQKEIIYSVVENDETFVPAAHMMGKDFVSAFIVLWFFLSRHPVRVVTTSADYSQLESVLWGEMRRFIQEAKHPLEYEKGGPLVVNHLHIRKMVNNQVDGLSYLISRVAAKGEGMQGHHIAETGDGVPRTMWVADEASGVDDLSYKAADSWAKRKLVIGNCYPCQNFFRRGVKGGDVYEKVGAGGTIGSLPGVDEGGDTNRESTLPPHDLRSWGHAGGLPGTGGQSVLEGGQSRAGEDKGVEADPSFSNGPGGTGRRLHGVSGDTGKRGQSPGTKARATEGPGTGGMSPVRGARNDGGTTTTPLLPGSSNGGSSGRGISTHPGRCYRKVIRIKGEHSPNVRAALSYVHRGLTPPVKFLIPGVLPWLDYKKRRETWDPVMQCVGLDADFWEGAEVLLYPPQWLNRAEAIAEAVRLLQNRTALGVGVDPGEGGANTCWTAVDEWGILEQISLQTPDTSVIIKRTLAFTQRWGAKAEAVCFDRGGGGKQIADEMRSRGVMVRTVGFGEPVLPEPKVGSTWPHEKVDQREERYTYGSRRCQMYGALRELLDPVREEAALAGRPRGFGIPKELVRLRAQLAVIPLLYDKDGRLHLPPKHRTPGMSSTEKTLTELIGHSPDEADSLVLAIYAMQNKPRRARIGVS